MKSAIFAKLDAWNEQAALELAAAVSDHRVIALAVCQYGRWYVTVQPRADVATLR
jgi:hypothetical protein